MTLTVASIAQRGPYQLEQRLGQGLLGATYRAVDTRSGQRVILKTLSETLLSHPQAQPFSQQFAQLARRFAACPHPHLLPIQEVFSDRGQPFYVADYIPGQTLIQVMQAQGGPLDDQTALRYIRQVAEGVSALHRQGLYHGDIQPQNILLESGTDRIVLTDFNLVRSLTPGHSQTQTLLKSVGYTAPELAEPEQTFSPASEVYSLAATLYYLVTGLSPVPASLRDQVPLIPPRQLKPQLTIVLEQAILLGLQPSPRQRPKSIAAWLELLPTSPVAAPLIASSLNLPKIPPRNSTVFKSPAKVATPPVQTPISATGAESDSPQPTALKPQPKWRKPTSLPMALVMTALAAGGTGVGFGLALRYHASQSPGSSLLNAEQTFPPRDQWPISDHPATPVETQLTRPEIHHR